MKENLEILCWPDNLLIYISTIMYQNDCDNQILTYI